MSADDNLIHWNRTDSRASSFSGAYESRQGHGRSFPGTSAAVKTCPTNTKIPNQGETRHFSQQADPEDELGRFDSQQFLELVKYGSRSEESVKKANRYSKDFKTTINVEREHLEGEINRQRAQSSSRHMEFSEHFGAAYAPLLCDNQTFEEQSNHGSSRFRNYLRQKSTDVLSTAVSLIDHLQKSCRELAAQRASLTVDTNWQQDTQRMKRILDSGRQIGEQKVDSIFTGIGNPKLDAQTAEVSQLLYDEHVRLAGDLTWDQAVQKQEKAIMRLVSTLP